MENELLVAPGYRAVDYLLVLQPHEELWNMIMEIKKKFAKDYECETALYTKPHITLVRFRQIEMMETRIIQQLKNITMTLSPIKVELKEFGSFPSHTIYINITSKVPIVNMVKALRAPQKLMKLDKDNKPHFITEPHLTIARKLQPWQYEKSWLEFEHKHFHGRFIADHALLLKRREGNKAYQIATKFVFQKAQVETKQGELFMPFPLKGCKKMFEIIKPFQ
jgi:2'-5' RNA ligase